MDQLPLFAANLAVVLLLGIFMLRRSRRVTSRLVNWYRWAGWVCLVVAALDAVIVLLIVSGVRSPNS